MTTRPTNVLDRVKGLAAERRASSRPEITPVGAADPSELERQRNRLAEELAELQWDLGGLAYEMAVRDHFRLDVLTRQAARLQTIDAELGEVERLLRLEQAGAAGSCAGCGALHGRGAVYCWQCGADLMARTAVSA